jgi:hypothetical protein
MNFEDMKFPLYRKYKNNKSFFKIINAQSFEEIQLIGNKRIIKTIEAKLFPEKNFIRDLIYNFQEMAVEIKGEEYERMKLES